MAARLVLGAALLAAVTAAFLLREQFNFGAVTAIVDSLGIWAPIFFVLLFGVAAVVFFPGAVFGLAGGALFGPFWGTALNVVGGTFGAILAFLIARYAASEWMAQRTGGKLKELIAGVESEGWRFVALIRLVPIFPYNLTNYTLGLTRISFVQYVAATFVCMIPGSAAYAWLGFAGRSATTGDRDTIWYGLLGLAALAIIAFLPRLLKRLRPESDKGECWMDVTELSAALQRADEPIVIDVREPDEFVGGLGHIPDAVNIPLGAIIADPNQFARGKEGLLVLVCRTDRRSARAADAVRNVGLRSVRVLRGGMERWNDLGMPVLH
ncbi:MAG: sulfurtransferase [Alphaproteobacteria bacterium]|nr:sulfurtransferase [Alphaproteobacteria bacterium]